MTKTLELVGYRVVALAGGKLTTLSGGQPVDDTVGSIHAMPGAGLFLGTDRAFCEAYYCGLTDGEDVMLTYAYSSEDLLCGDPHASSGEVTVRRARLIVVENLSRPAPSP